MKIGNLNLNKIAMIAFICIIVFFIVVSSYLYFTNTNNVEIKIKSDNAINREKTLINEALTRTLVLKDDTLILLKNEIKTKDSITAIKLDSYEKTVTKLERQKDSINKILRNLKQSDLQPIQRTN